MQACFFHRNQRHLETVRGPAGLEGSCWRKGVAEIQGESAWGWLRFPGRQKTHDSDQPLPPLTSSPHRKCPPGAWPSLSWGSLVQFAPVPHPHQVVNDSEEDRVRLEGPLAWTVPPPGCSDGCHFPTGKGGRADQEMTSLMRPDTVQIRLPGPGGLFLCHQGKALAGSA